MRVASLLASLLLLACGIGVLVFREYRTSERYIVESLRAAHQRGATLSVEQCVDHVVAWAPRCQAMRKMCEWSAARMTHACLVAQDRRPYCEALTVSTSDRRFGYQECRTRGATRGARKKACASAYGRVASHCRWLRRDQARRASREAKRPTPPRGGAS